jgi:hypothetical protein
MDIFTGVYALIKAIPYVYKGFIKIVDLYISEQVSQIISERITLDKEIEVLYKKVSEASSNEERIVLANAIDRINNP